MTYVLQGEACEFGKCFAHGDDVLYLKSGCFDAESDNDVRLLINHGGKSLATTADRLQIHAGADALIFRFVIPDSFSKQFAELADDFETYTSASVGFKFDKFETLTIDGMGVKVITSATLREISLLDKEPAIKTTYARFVSDESCCSLEEDYERIRLVGRVVALQRAQKASENGGKVEWMHVTSAMDRAANRFTRALNALV